MAVDKRGLISRVIEYTLGRDHLNNFRAYLEAGGLMEILRGCGISERVTHRSESDQGAHKFVLLSESPAQK